ncbi:histidine phosphatase family protein [bacterium]|nr:histidine phosphatase family protein [bacterium]MBU1958667.1 histidine phosphatase family protein [bacterium]
MKKLYLIRHAKSSWNDLNLDDFDRPLNKRGKHDAKLMAERLKSKKIKPDLIIASPAKRASITANTIAKKIGYDLGNIDFQETVYEASLSDLLTVLKSIDNKNDVVFLIGHNPSLNSLLDYLVERHDIENIVTTGMVEIELDVERWNEITKNSGKVVLFEFPKKYY